MDLPQFRGPGGWVMLEITLMKLAYGRLKEARSGWTENPGQVWNAKKHPPLEETVVALSEDSFPTFGEEGRCCCRRCGCS